MNKKWHDLHYGPTSAVWYNVQYRNADGQPGVSLQELIDVPAWLSCHPGYVITGFDPQRGTPR